MATNNVIDTTPASEKIRAVAALATAKGYSLYECVPLTQGSQPWWKIHKASSMKFFATFGELSEHVSTVAPWQSMGTYSVDL